MLANSRPVTLSPATCKIHDSSSNDNGRSDGTGTRGLLRAAACKNAGENYRWLNVCYVRKQRTPDSVLGVGDRAAF